MKKTPTYAFLVHPRNMEDVFRKFPLFQKFPRSLLHWMLVHMPPVHVSTIEGLRDTDGQQVAGMIVSIPLTAKMMLEDRSLALRKMKKAISYLEKRGVRLVGLGALTASLSRGGKDLVGTDVGITTGRAYTVKTVTDYVKDVVHRLDIPKEHISLGIVGASGSIGRGCAIKLAEWGIKKFHLIDLERKLSSLDEKLHSLHQQDDITTSVSHQTKTLKEKGVHIVIAATNAPEAIIRAEDLAQGSIVINDAQPSDVAPDVYSQEDSLVIEGGVVETPHMNYHFNMGLASKHNTFCCLAEVLILAHNQKYDDFSLGELSLENIDILEELSEGSDITLSKYQNMYGYIEEEKVEKVFEALRLRSEQNHGSN